MPGKGSRQQKWDEAHKGQLKRIQVIVNADQMEMIRTAAAADGVSVSAYVRQAALDRADHSVFDDLLLLTKMENRHIPCSQMSMRLYQSVMIVTAKHREGAELWQHGDPSMIWTDEPETISVMYESGSFWHYNRRGEWY